MASYDNLTVQRNTDFAKAMTPDEPLDIAVAWIRLNLAPEWVFTESQLAEWAEENGYVLKDES